MYRMLIVDDEDLIRTGILRIINWEEYDIEIIGEAENGQDALAKIKCEHPDIVMLDIMMPVMNGLELLQALHESGDMPSVIVLSGYSDFEYVRQSMKLGAVNYLLKPICVDELISTISDIVICLESSSDKRDLYIESISTLRWNTINRMLNGTIENKELREKCRLLDINAPENLFAACLIYPVLEAEDEYVNALLQRLIAEFEKNTGDIKVYLTISSDRSIVGIIVPPEEITAQAVIQEYLASCSSTCFNLFGNKCITSHGCLVRNYRELPRSYREAVNMRNFRLMCGDNHAIPAIPDKDIREIEDFCEQNDLSEMLVENHTEKIPSHVHDFCLSLISHGYIEDRVMKYYAVAYLNDAVRLVRNLTPTRLALQSFLFDSYQRIEATRDIRALERVLTEALQELSQLKTRTVFGSYSPLIRLVVSKIQSDYSDVNMSLKTLSLELHMSASYLGKQFRIETGMFFSEYLNNVRIHEASSLITTTPLRIAEIAEKVGFSSINYFNSVFKKTAGCAPSELRKKSFNASPL